MNVAYFFFCMYQLPGNVQMHLRRCYENPSCCLLCGMVLNQMMRRHEVAS